MKWNTWSYSSLALSLALFSATSATADYMLHTLNLDKPHVTVVERFISYNDCRKRGIRNQTIGQLFGGRVGFYCLLMEDLYG